MDLILYKTSDADNVIGKVLTDGLTMDVLLRSDTDVVNPTLVLEGDFREFNYCSIPELGKFYFIRDVTMVSNTLVKLDCECDYLETYKSEILAGHASHRRVMQAGDFGEVSLDTTGREIVSEHFSDVELVESTDAILSVLNGELTS